MANNWTISKKVSDSCDQILELKASGNTDKAIKKELKLSNKAYLVRMKHIQESDYFRNQAIQACQEGILRLQSLRRAAFARYVKIKDTENHSAIVSYLRQTKEIDIEIINLAYKLNFWPKLAPPEHNEAKSDVSEPKKQENEDLSGLDIDELQRRYFAKIKQDNS